MGEMMKRLIDHYLRLWIDDPYRKPLLLRGARQVGKTYAARQLGTLFDSFVEVNLEQFEKARSIFSQDLDPHRIIRDLSILMGVSITPGKTLLFIDEIQARPEALTALRYMYEIMPELHVIAAGSLLDFAIEQVGIPVGRVASLYVYPLSFLEFLAHAHEILLREILQNKDTPLSEFAHTTAFRLLGQYIAIGGMPEAVSRWLNTDDPFNVARVHHQLLDTYRQDFSKYAKKHQVKYVEQVFRAIPEQLGDKFKFARIEGEYRKRELAPALDLLETAGIAHRVFNSSGQGVPLGAQVDPQDYKILFIDVGLAQASLNLDLSDWFLKPQEAFVNKGMLVEAFVGQEMLVYADAHRKHQLYYWQRQAKSSNAEIDYLIQKEQRVIPIEVKSGAGTGLKSMRMFLETHMATPYGIRFAAQPHSVYEKLHSYPLYAVAQVCAAGNQLVHDALAALLN
jgi:predicted AAA+ superfamily ATPase